VSVGAMEVRGRKAADARADDDQVVLFAGIRRRWPGGAVAQGMSVFEGTGVVAAKAGEQRRVVAGGICAAVSAGAAARRGAPTATVAPTAIPFRKSRRLMGRFMPSRRSWERSCFSCVMSSL
jgi:hypothetical protein